MNEIEPTTLKATSNTAELGSLAVLGSTGSVGTQTLDLVRRNPEQFRVAALAVNRSAEQVIAQAREFKPAVVAVADAEQGQHVRDALGGQCRVLIGPGAASVVAALPEVHTVVAGMVGFSSLSPVVAAISAHKQIALANKEVLVACGPLIKKLMLQSHSFIAPLDSEHNALFQCLLGRGRAGLRRIVITASGGPFREAPLERLRVVTPEEAIRHPRWSMGPKISIDSASLMNKGLEVIEAAMLFDLPGEQIEVLVHPQSVLHGMVEYTEGSSLAVLYEPDMRVSIGFALSYLRSEDPLRIPGAVPVNSGASFLDLAGTGRLEFYRPDLTRFPGLGLCYEALAAGGCMPAVLNAANEIAVQAFVDREIGFMQMSEVVAQTMRQWTPQPPETIECISSADAAARAVASNIVDACSAQFVKADGAAVVEADGAAGASKGAPPSTTLMTEEGH